ncbi:hypothetical protein BH23ACI1_BH23ACI1_17730 [soil metagenome]
MPTRQLAGILGLALLLAVSTGAQQKEAYDYRSAQREMIQRGHEGP